MLRLPSSVITSGLISTRLASSPMYAWYTPWRNLTAERTWLQRYRERREDHLER